MSLINEALKKAQRQRSLDSAPLASAPSGVAAAAVATHVRAASHKRSFAPLWFGLGVLAIGAGAAVLVMRYGFERGAEATQVSAVPQRPVAPTPSTPAPALAQTSPSLPGGAEPTVPPIVLPPLSAGSAAPAAAQPPAAPAPASPAIAVTPASPSSTAVATQAAPSLRQADSAPAAVAPAPAPAAAATIAQVVPVAAVDDSAERRAKIQAFLNTARITGVRGGDRDARLLMNERVWRLGETVAPELGLRLQAVRAGWIVFSDAQGKTYEKAY